MKIRFFLLSVILAAICSCSTNNNSSNSNVSGTKSENVAVANSTPEANKLTESNSANTDDKKIETADNTTCYNLKREDLMIDKKQTFAIDFKPFEKSCFVTFHDPEFDNPPLGERFFIYKNGKEVFNFPEQFGEGNVACWIDAVSFEDLNEDQLKDIVIVGKCGGKSSDFNENMVYINTGKEFVTNADSNVETMDFSKISQIREFVKKNPKMFIP